MIIPDKEFDHFISEQKARNGDLWVRILGEVQAAYNEACLWVLVANEHQVKTSLEHLRDRLKPYHERYPETKFTISFTMKHDGKRYHCGFIEGEEIFSDRGYDIIGAEPRPLADEEDIFDQVKD